MNALALLFLLAQVPSTPVVYSAQDQTYQIALLGPDGGSDGGVGIQCTIANDGGIATVSCPISVQSLSVQADAGVTAPIFKLSGGGYLGSAAGDPMILEYPSGGLLEILIGSTNVTSWSASGVETVVYGFALGNGSVQTNQAVGACTIAHSASSCSVATPGTTYNSTCIASETSATPYIVGNMASSCDAGLCTISVTTVCPNISGCDAGLYCID